MSAARNVPAGIIAAAAAVLALIFYAVAKDVRQQGWPEPGEVRGDDVRSDHQLTERMP